MRMKCYLDVKLRVAVVVVNVIDEEAERVMFKRMVAEAMPTHEIWCCEVPSVAEVSKRHCIFSQHRHLYLLGIRR